jgi:hypothetical protein
MTAMAEESRPGSDLGFAEKFPKTHSAESFYALTRVNPGLEQSMDWLGDVGTVRDTAPAECARPGMSGATVPPPRNLDVSVNLADNQCMSAHTCPSEAEVMAARAVLKADRLARMRERRAARRTRAAFAPKFPTAPYLCAYCGTPFEARSLRRAVMGRYCSASCRQLAYKNRCRVAAVRQSTRTSILAGMEA